MRVDKYDPSEDIAKGLCGYDGCELPLLGVDVDAEEGAISCEAHNETWDGAYNYMKEGECQERYNGDTDGAFRACFDNAHEMTHNDGNGEKNFPVGDVVAGGQHYRISEREYGAWTCTAPLHRRTTLTAPNANVKHVYVWCGCTACAPYVASTYT